MAVTIVETRAITGGADTHANAHVAAALDPVGGLLGVREVLARYGDDPAPRLQEQSAVALFNKGVRSGELGRLEEAVAAYDQVLARCGDDPAPGLREQAAVALVNKGVVLARLGRPAEAVAAYDQVLAHYGNDLAAELRETAERARSALAEIPGDPE